MQGLDLVVVKQDCIDQAAPLLEGGDLLGGQGMCRSYHFLFLRPSWRRSVAPPCTASQIFANALDPSSSTGTHCEPASLTGMALLG